MPGLSWHVHPRLARPNKVLADAISALPDREGFAPLVQTSAGGAEQCRTGFTLPIAPELICLTTRCLHLRDDCIVCRAPRWRQTRYVGT